MTNEHQTPQTFGPRQKRNMGGHASGSLRDRFCDAVEGYWQLALRRRKTMTEAQSTAITRLWNCSDILPAECFHMVGDILECHGRQAPRRQTYASAARALAFLKST